MQQQVRLSSCLEFMGNQRKCFLFVDHDGLSSKLNFSYTLCTLSQLYQDKCNTSNTFFLFNGIYFYLCFIFGLSRYVLSISDIIHSRGFLLKIESNTVALVDRDIVPVNVYCQLLSFQTKIKLSNQRRMYCLLTLIV